MEAKNVPLNVLIIDDEKKACVNLNNILLEFIDPSINVLGYAHNTSDAERKIKELKPDAVFLDIEMQDENAFLFLQRMAPVNFDVIFVTAYDEYAVKAFRFNAIDYILKPISIFELNAAVDKLKHNLVHKKINTETTIPFAELSNQISNKTRPHKITLKDNNAIEIVDFKDILFIEAQSSYAKIAFMKDGRIKEMLLTGSLSEYEELLPSDIFYRIHKSYMINCNWVKKIINDEHTHVTLKNNIDIPISRRRFAGFLEFLKKH